MGDGDRGGERQAARGDRDADRDRLARTARKECQNPRRLSSVIRPARLTSEQTTPTPGETSQRISQGVVRLLRDYTGRGPTHAQTTITDGLVVVVLRDTLLKAERSLVEDGHADAVVAMRRRYQDTMREELIALVAGQTGRTVEAFMSDNAIDPDIAVEVFVLGPQ
jgi:uncharacterized protein YbcI